MLKYEGAKNVLSGRTRSLDVPIVLLSAGALILVGPLRGAFEAYPLVPFASTLFLFVVPGLLLSHWFLGEYFSGAALVPVSFVISTGIFGLLGVPILVAHLSLDAYLWVIGTVLTASLTAALLSGSLFFLIHLEPSIFTFGGEFISRIVEDKFVARFLFLPVALALAVAFVESRK